MPRMVIHLDGYPWPTRTQEMLCLVMARLGRPKPTVGGPWPSRPRRRRWAEIERVVGSLHRRDVAVYVDEVDIHLNPKIGCDWITRNHRCRTMTDLMRQVMAYVRRRNRDAARRPRKVAA